MLRLSVVSIKVLDVQAGDISKVKELREKQQNICKVQKDMSSAGTGLEQTRDNNSRGMTALQSGLHGKIGKQNFETK